MKMYDIWLVKILNVGVMLYNYHFNRPTTLCRFTQLKICLSKARAVANID